MIPALIILSACLALACVSLWIDRDDWKRLADLWRESAQDFARQWDAAIDARNEANLARSRKPGLAPVGAPRTCSFCSSIQSAERRVIAGPGAFICDECVSLCNDILAEPPSPLELGAPSAPGAITASYAAGSATGAWNLAMAQTGTETK